MVRRRGKPRWLRDGSGAVDSGPMTNQYMAARLGYLEQALEQLAQDNNSLARLVREQYIARFFDDLGTASQKIFWDYLNRLES